MVNKFDEPSVIRKYYAPTFWQMKLDEHWPYIGSINTLAWNTWAMKRNIIPNLDIKITKNKNLKVRSSIMKYLYIYICLWLDLKWNICQFFFLFGAVNFWASHFVHKVMSHLTSFMSVQILVFIRIWFTRQIDIYIINLIDERNMFTSNPTPA